MLLFIFQRGHLPLTEAVLQGKINCQKITTLSQNGTTNSASTTENSSLNKSTTASNNQGKSRKSGSQNNTVSNQKTGTLLNYSDRHSGLNTQNIPRITATNMTGTGTEGSGLLNAQVEIPDEKDARFCVLSYEQVKRLNDLMSEVINVHGLGNWATIDVRLSDLVSVVKSKLESDGIKVHEIRLNGSGASSVLASSDINYNDLDLIFSVDLSTAKAFDRVKTACLQSLMELLPEGVCRKRMSSCKLEEAYVSKKVKVNDSGDRWSLISLGKFFFFHILYHTELLNKTQFVVFNRDEFKLEFSGSSPAELEHFNFRAETELTILTICRSKNSNFVHLS